MGYDGLHRIDSSDIYSYAFSPLDQSGVGIRFSHFTHPLLLADGCSVNCDVNHTMSLGMLVESRVNLSLVTIID